MTTRRPSAKIYWTINCRFDHLRSDEATMPEFDCREFDDAAAELALGVLVGRERAAALGHLEHCARCREVVADLSVTADRLLELIPDVEPAPGLEQRVTAALTAGHSGGGRRPIVPLWRRYARGAGLATAFLLGGLVLGNDAPPASQQIRLVPAPHAAPWTGAAEQPIPTENIVLYAPLTEGNLQVGQAYLYDGADDWMYLSLNSTSGGPVVADTNVTCTLVRPDGSTTPLGTFVLRHGQGSWAGAAPDPTGTSPTANVVDSAGRVVATAHFTDSDDPPPAAQIPRARK
jgi:hypothetical protein